MNALSSVHALHEKVDTLLAESTLETFAASVHWTLRGLNSSAYFVLLFAAFENIINEAYCNETGLSLKQRRCRCGRHFPTFRDRVEALWGNSDMADEILGYYAVRCELAHGIEFEDLPFPLEEAFRRFSQLTAGWIDQAN